MIKVVGLIKRKPGLSREEFFKHYEEVHAPMALKYFPTFKGYLRNHVVSITDPPSEEEPQFDCITEIWYEDKEAAKAAIDFWRSDDGKVMLADNETFMDMGTMVFYIVKEVVSKQPTSAT